MADGVRIETEGVTAVAASLRADVDKGFASAVSRAAGLHTHGVVFGAALPGEAVLDARQRYAQALAHTDANLRAYRDLAATLATEADRIVAELTRADQLSQESQRRLAALLNPGGGTL